MHIEQILQRLEAVKSTANRFMARCSVETHEDRTPSLSVRQTGGKILIHCFGPCTTDDVLKAIHLEQYAPPRRPQISRQPSITAIRGLISSKTQKNPLVYGSSNLPTDKR